MIYSVNFSENDSGKIVLGNVIINGTTHTPSEATEVFTKDPAGILTISSSLNVANIKYLPTGAPGGVTPPKETVGEDKNDATAVGATAVGATAVGATGVAPTKVETEATGSERGVPEGELVGEKVEATGTEKEETTEETRAAEATTASKPITSVDSKSQPVLSGNHGGSSRKTKRNRRKNKRFAKKSYKRRR